MTDQTENPNASAQDDIKTVLQDTLFQQVQTLLNFTHTDGFALQIPETDTLILTGPLTRIAEFVQREIAAPAASFSEQPLWDDNGEPWNEAAEKVEQARHAVTRQPVGGLPPLPNPVFKDIAAGGFLSENAYTAKQMEDHARAAIAAHIAGTSQATKAQAEPILLRKKFFDLPLGTRFRYVGGKEEWVVLERHGRGKVAGYQPHDGWVAGQSIFSFADSEEECRTLEVDVVLAAPVAKEAPAVPEGYVLMPARLTAENGAKSLLTGEFKESIELTCEDCADAEEPEDCQTCAGQGTVHQDVTVGWDTIKNIYALAVEHLSAAPVASVAKEAPLYNVRPGVPTASQVQAEEAELYRTLTGDAMALGFDSITAALRALRAARDAETGAQASADGIEQLPDLMDEWANAPRGAHASAVYKRIVKAIDSHFCATTTSTVSAPQPVDGVRWDLFPGYLIDHCENDIISEEGLQHSVASMLKDPDYIRVCAEGAQKAPEDVRKNVLDEVEEAVEQVIRDLENDAEERSGAYSCRTAIQALRTSSTDQANADTGSEA